MSETLVDERGRSGGTKLSRRRRLSSPHPGETTRPAPAWSETKRALVTHSSTRVDGVYQSASARLGLAFLLAVVAQGILMTLPRALAPPSALLDSLRPIWPHAGPVVVATMLFIVAAAWYGSVVAAFAGEAPWPAASFKAELTGRSDPVFLGCLTTGVALLGFVVVRLATTDDEPGAATWFVLALALTLAGLAWHERERLARGWHALRRLRYLGEAIYVAVAVGGFAYLSWFDLPSWFYSSLGDEYAFYQAARNAGQGAVVNVFSQRGAYDIIPVLSSYVEGLLMRLFGMDVVGWKLSIVAQVCLALVLVYLLARTLFGRRVAGLTLGLLAPSHYLLAYAHTGYPNLETLLPSIGAFLGFVVGVSRRSLLALVGAGFFAGLGWYTYYPSRATIGILALALVLTVRPRSWVTAGAPLLGGFLFFFLPMAATSKTEIVTRMFEQTGEGSTTEVVANRALLPLWNAGRSLLAFNYNTHDGPYLLGSLLEPVTALFFVLGLGCALATWRDRRSRFLLAWYGLGIVVTGVLSKYDYVSVSRLNYLLPVTVLLAALAVDRGLQVLSREVALGRRARGLAPDQARVLSGAVVGLVLGLSLYANLHRWFVEMPGTVPSTPDALTLKVVETPACQTALLPPLVVDVGIGGAMGPALEAMSGSVVKPQFALYSDPPTWIETATARCVIFRDPTNPRAVSLAQQVSARWPGRAPVDEPDRSGRTYVRVFYPPARG